MPGYDLETDVIVIGSGFAGLAAAIEAAEAGCRVIVLEKMGSAGGNSRISHGGIAAPGTDYQEQRGISDSPGQMYEDMLAAGEGLNYPELVKTVTENAKEAFYWARDYLGVKFLNRVDLFGGHSIARSYTPVSISGKDLIEKQLARLKKLKVPVYLQVYVESLITTPDKNRVTGVKTIFNHRFSKGNNRSDQDAGQKTNCFARKAVIVSSGGFSSDIAFRAAQDPRLDENLQSTNMRFATAEIIKETLNIGANPVQLSRIQLAPSTSPDEKGFGTGPMFGEYVAIPLGMLVDPKTGERFVNELGDRKMLSEAMLALGHPAIGIADEKAVTRAGWDLTRALNKEVVRCFDTSGELAAHYKMEKNKFEATMKRFNEMIELKEDRDFCKPVQKDAVPLVHPPFYAMRMWPKVHYTMGGIQVDTSTRVIHRDQGPIEGLFAAGEATAGVHGACRLGSCAITECLVMGRIAGKNAAG